MSETWNINFAFGSLFPFGFPMFASLMKSYNMPWNILKHCNSFTLFLCFWLGFPLMCSVFHLIPSASRRRLFQTSQMFMDSNSFTSWCFFTNPSEKKNIKMGIISRNFRGVNKQILQTTPSLSWFLPSTHGSFSPVQLQPHYIQGTRTGVPLTVWPMVFSLCSLGISGDYFTTTH